jgi:hypothetical protein
MATRKRLAGLQSFLRQRKVLLAIGGLVLVAAGAGIGVAQTGGASSSTNKDLVILANVQRRTLQDTITLNGTLARKELSKVTPVTQGRVSSVYATTGETAKAGDSLFALDGRDAIAEPGTVSFFRALGPGDQGDDVLQLKKILAAAGDKPGPLDTAFTQQTQNALAHWQAQHHYPSATAAGPESLTIALTQGSGYKLGAQAAAGLTISPPQGQTAAAVMSGRGPLAELTALRPHITAPTLTIQSVDAVVPEGVAASFLITASAAPGTDTTVNLDNAGTADNNDIVTPPTSVVLPASATSVTVSVPTRLDNVVKPDKTLTMSIISGTGYTLGSPISAQTTITNNNVPTLTLTGGVTVSPGGSATLTVTADQAPLHDTQVSLTFAGDAAPGTDYHTVNPVLTLGAGTTSTSVTINTLVNPVIQPDRHIVVSINAAPGSYSIGSPGITVITVSGATGSAALPLLTLRSAVTSLVKGQPFAVTVGLSEALSSSLTIALTYGGTAVQGTDYTPPAGSIVVPAGQTSAQVSIPTITDNSVEADRVLTVSLAPSAAYQVGSPSRVSVTITSSVLPSLSITIGTPTVPQGGTATFTITADQAPVKDTSVSYTVVGTAQPGQDYQPLVGTAVLKAGQTIVTVVLQSLEKDVVFEPTDMIVANWPIRVGQVYVKAGDPVAPGAPILSLTQPTFTVTLQASASDRTKLQLGQHCTVQLVGGENQVSGTISELDADQTLIGSGSGGSAAGGAGGGSSQQQVYEGQIQVPDLGAADGAAVTIDVVDQQATNVLTVPIAAVKQNGVGQQVVRVIDVAHGGKVTEVPVSIGLTEGSYVEITKGLQGDEKVIVDVNQNQ